MQTATRSNQADLSTPQANARACRDMAPLVTDAHVTMSRQISDTLQRLGEQLNPKRRLVRAGDVIYRAGEPFANLYILNAGICKMVSLTADGREQLVSLSFRGDWLGFDGLAGGHYGADAIAMDTGEVWAVPYQTLLEVGKTCPEVLHALHTSMSQAIARDRDSLMSVCTLPAVARVADFLLNWVDSLADRGIRTDQITLRMTRAEIGNHLGMTLESVSRALSRLARDQVIGFATQGRRDVQIPDAGALSAFVRRHVSAAPALLQ